MNSNGTAHFTGTKTSECQTTFLGEKPNQSTTEGYAVHVYLAVLSSIACPLITGLNLLVIISVKRKPQLKTIANIVLGCLVVTDALMGLIGLPLFATSIILTFQAETSSDFCAVKGVFRTVLRTIVGAMWFHVILMNVERYIAIKHPFQHTTLVTKSRVLGSSALAWISVVLFISLPVGVTNNAIYLTFDNITLLFSMAVIIYCQAVVCCETRRQEKLIAAQQVTVEARMKSLKERKALTVTTTVLVTFIISLLPIFVVRILVKMAVVSETLAAALASSSAFVYFLNSLTNSIIYCVGKRQFRVAFIEILLGKSNAQAQELEMRVFGSRNNNENNKNSNNNDNSNHNISNFQS